MIYIFEDNENADISVLFKEAYREYNRNLKFIYVMGNGRLYSEAKKQLELCNNEEVAVYMDMIPCNPDCAKIFRELSKLSRKNNYRVIIMPIVCAEYYMIKSLEDKDFINDEHIKCINKEQHFKSDLLKNDNYAAKYCKNFEKYCKYILKFTSKRDCIKPMNVDKKIRGEYYRQDCLCSKPDNECKSLSLINKSLALLSQYQYVPALTGRVTSDAWEIHRKLVEEYNNFVTKYREADSTGKYEYVKPIK